MRVDKLFAKFSVSSVRCASTKIMKYLNVAEKNDAAKHISQFLSKGASNRREGFSKFNKIYEFDATVLNRSSRMVMTSVSGHLLNCEFVGTFRSWNSCNPIALFDAPIVKTCSTDGQKIKKTLEHEVRSCDGLIIWTDCDREGENIGFEIIKVCKDVKADLTIYRAKFSEITAASVFRALNNLIVPDKNVSDAVDVRQELDLRTGAAFTRLQTLRLQKVFPGKLSERLISYGSCQFPTLGFVVDRYVAIEQFIPEPFWKIKLNHTIKDLTVDFVWKRDRLFTKTACEALHDVCQENPTATIESVDSKTKNKWRPLPLDTVEMEKNVSRKLRINAKETMKIAERLYTQGFISYPRTETNIFPKELNLTPLVEQQRVDNRWGEFAARVMNEGGPNARQGKKSDQAHPPIHPTKHAPALQGNEQRVYEYIVRHFLACVSKDAVGHETTVLADVAGEKFTAKGLLVLERNYLDVYTYEKWNAKEIHRYVMGQTFTPTVLELAEGSTSAPSLLTEADLIALMEKHGIGTDATHADHIDTIKSREYVGIVDNMYFVPATLGMGLVEGYNNIGLEVSLAKPNLRADFENDLKLISNGTKSPDVVRMEQIAKYKAVYATVTEKILQIDQKLAARINETPASLPNDANFQNQTTDGNDGYNPFMKCPKCGNDMIVKQKRDGQWAVSCIGFPDCKNYFAIAGSISRIEVVDDTCNECRPPVKKLKIQFTRNPFYGEPNPNVLCVGGCTEDVLETLDIPLGKVKKVVGQQRTNNSLENNATVANQNNANARGYRAELQMYNGNTNPRAPIASNNDGGQMWAVPTNNPNNNNNSQTTTRRNSLPNNTNTVCSCNKPAMQLTVRKEGPNTGRKFYKCPSGLDNGGCNFFLWADDGETSASTSTHQPSAPPPSNQPPKCKCNSPAAFRTVQKDGPNKGRKFYACSKPIGTGCDFFKWADDVEVGTGGGDDGWGGGGGGGGLLDISFGCRGPSTSSGWRGKGTKRKNNSNGYNKRGGGSTEYDGNNKKPKAKRKCGLCGEEGHTRNKCPNA